MTNQLPAPIATFIQAINAHDGDATLQTFAPNAVVDDDGQHLIGTDALKTWIDDQLIEPRFTIEVTGVSAQNSDITLTVLASGNFDGSPLPFTWHATLTDGKIATFLVD